MQRDTVREELSFLCAVDVEHRRLEAGRPTKLLRLRLTKRGTPFHAREKEECLLCLKPGKCLKAVLSGRAWSGQTDHRVSTIPSSKKRIVRRNSVGEGSCVSRQLGRVVETSQGGEALCW